MPQDLLTMSGGAMNALTVLSATTPRLSEILTRATDAHEAAQFITDDEVLVSECRRMLPIVQRLAKPVQRAEIKIALQPLLLMFDPPSFGKGREAEQLEGAWQEVYVKALSGLSREALEHAITRWCEIGKTFPKPAHLRELAEPVQLKVALVAWRMRKAVEIADKAWKAAQSVPDDPQVKAGFKALLAELGASVAPPGVGKLASDPHQAAEHLRSIAR